MGSRTIHYAWFIAAIAAVMAWFISMAASLGGMVCILLLEPTSRLLIPNWEASLPPEAGLSVPSGRP